MIGKFVLFYFQSFFFVVLVMPTRLIKYLVVIKLQTLWQPWSFLGTRKQVQCLFVLLSGFL